MKKSKYTKDKTLFNWRTLINLQKRKRKQKAKKLFLKTSKLKKKTKSW